MANNLGGVVQVDPGFGWAGLAAFTQLETIKFPSRLSAAVVSETVARTLISTIHVSF
ncbi:MAG TPA: hypothetical protein VFC39_15730 [Acidobacteriaceae bacterium]|nr:hypothetical protein [Acidobacteriaceae bacterium]